MPASLTALRGGADPRRTTGIHRGSSHLPSLAPADPFTGAQRSAPHPRATPAPAHRTS